MWTDRGTGGAASVRDSREPKGMVPGQLPERKRMHCQTDRETWSICIQRAILSPSQILEGPPCSRLSHSAQEWTKLVFLPFSPLFCCSDATLLFTTRVCSIVAVPTHVICMTMEVAAHVPFSRHACARGPACARLAPAAACAVPTAPRAARRRGSRRSSAPPAARACSRRTRRSRRTAPSPRCRCSGCSPRCLWVSAHAAAEYL